MVLYSTGHSDKMKIHQKNMTIALLHEALKEAAYDGRLIKGLADCSKILQSDPDNLVICVLPETTSSSSIAQGIQTILIESLCLESGIPVVRVDVKENGPLRCHSLEKEFADLKLKSDWEHDESSPILQLDCLFIQKRNGDAGNSEQKLMSLLQSAEEDGYTEFPE